MGNFKSATCKYCKMGYTYNAGSYTVICPHCNKKITTPEGTKRDVDRGLTTVAKILARLIRL